LRGKKKMDCFKKLFNNTPVSWAALPHWSLRWPLRRPIAAALYLVLLGLIRQLSLLREEF